jgi:hypothetical protein
MSILEKIEQFFTKDKANVEAKFIQTFEEKLPKEMRGLFVYTSFWTNGWCYDVDVMIDDVLYLLSWDDRKEKYEFHGRRDVQVPYTLRKLEAYVNR